MASPEAPWDKHMHMKNKYTNFKTMNTKPSKTLQSDHMNDSPQSCRDGRVIFHLDSYSETELKELKNTFISDLERIQSFIKQIEARELELLQVEDVENSVNKTSKIIGQKRTMSITSNRETKRKRLLKTMESETQKVEPVMMRRCGGILEKLMKHKHSWVFNEPVDVVALGLRDYHQVVKCPMDLGTVKLKFGKGVYRNPLDFAKDVRLTFHNAMLYNRKGEDVHTLATGLLGMFDKLFDQAYEKLEVECRVNVKQKKLSNPLADELKQSQVVSSQQDTKKPLQMHPQVALSKKICKEAAKKSVFKQERTVLEARENPRMKREMRDWEKEQLGLVLQDFAGENLEEILQIVAKRNPKMTTPDGDGEIELDIHALDSETMWDLHRFVRLNLKSEQNNKVI